MLIYLAAPYSHPNEKIRNLRMFATTAVACSMTQRGLVVYSPLTYAGALGGELLMPNEKWLPHGMLFLSRCTLLSVLQLPGYETSAGIMAEMSLAGNMNIPIHQFIEADILPIIGQERWNALKTGVQCNG